jgi:hypothetical protein
MSRIKRREDIVMPQFENVVEKLVIQQREDGVQKLPVSAEAYDVAQGVLHGTLQALATALLNPIDKKNAELVTSKKQSTIEPKKSFSNYFTYRGESPTAGVPASAVQNALVPVKAMPNALVVYKPPVLFNFPVLNTPASYGWRAQYQNFKNIFPNQPWAGTLYGIKVNIPRNAVAFTTLPLLRDQLEESFTPRQSVGIAGVGTGIVESLFTARARVIKTIMHTSKDNPTHKQVWASLPVVARGEKVKAAIKWGAAKGVAYWVTFPVLTQLCEEQFKQGINYFQLGDSYALRAADYLLAGALAGAVTPLISYPLDVLEKRAILNTGQNQIQKTWNYYCRYGLLSTIKHNTHVGFLKTALPRMMISSAFFNFTLHLAKSGCDVVFVKDEHHHKLPVASPVVSVPPNSSSPSLPVVADSVVATPAASTLPVASTVATVKPNSVVPVSASTLSGSNGLFSSSVQVVAANPELAARLFRVTPASVPEAMRFVGMFGPLAQQINTSRQKVPVVTPVPSVPSVPVESVKPKV